jgi:hypothetical protein
MFKNRTWLPGPRVTFAFWLHCPADTPVVVVAAAAGGTVRLLLLSLLLLLLRLRPRRLLRLRLLRLLLLSWLLLLQLLLLRTVRLRWLLILLSSLLPQGVLLQPLRLGLYLNTARRGGGSMKASLLRTASSISERVTSIRGGVHLTVNSAATCRRGTRFCGSQWRMGNIPDHMVRLLLLTPPLCYSVATAAAAAVPTAHPTAGMPEAFCCWVWCMLLCACCRGAS